MVAAASSARLRDYYRVEDEAGRRYWIYREGLIGDGRGGAAQLVHPRAVRLMPEKTGFSRLKLVRTGDMPPPPIDAVALCRAWRHYALSPSCAERRTRSSWC